MTFFSKTNKIAFLLFCPLSLTVLSCQSNDYSDSAQQSQNVVAKNTETIPLFDASETYQFIQDQVNFGPRVPGTKAQTECAQWLEQQLKPNCDTVYRQEVTVKAGNGMVLPCINLIGVIRPEAKHRVLLLAHWDSRPWADQDTKQKDQAILGADDGGSGTAVLLSLSKVLHQHPLPEGWGVDILLADVEDYGKTEWGDDSYALGTQYWAHHPHVANYKAQAGILLDMVGSKNARFPLEAYSQQHAGNVQQDVWQAASKAGFSSYFVYENGGQITDDHVPVNEILKIPTIDIINLPAGSMTGFGKYWHTHQDDMSVIDKNTLNAVGQTLLQYLYTR